MNFSFEAILVWVVIITGIVALFDTIYFAPKRIRAFHVAIQDSLDAASSNQKKTRAIKRLLSSIPSSMFALLCIVMAVLFWNKEKYVKRLGKKRKELDPALLKQHQSLLHPFVLIEWCKSFFPVLLLVLIIRSFLFSPYVVPTGSLEPTVLPGDFVVANKFAYGLRLPLSHYKFIAIGEPHTGDIVLFQFPPNPRIDYIKRAIGVPGDTISYIDKVIYINGQKMEQTFVADSFEENNDGQNSRPVKVYAENLKGVKHKIIVNPDLPAHNFYNIKVPEGYYFMMGDNRDDSVDSRYWGFVPEANIEARGEVIFFSKTPHSFHIRFSRMGLWL